MNKLEAIYCKSQNSNSSLIQKQKLQSIYQNYKLNLLQIRKTKNQLLNLFITNYKTQILNLDIQSSNQEFIAKFLYVELYIKYRK